MRTQRIGRIVWLSALFASAWMSAQAKVIFTGYGDLRYSPFTHLSLEGTPAALALFSPGDTTLTSRGSNIDSIGLFAATNLSPELDFLMDVTYRQVGVRVNDLRIQYAYLNYAPAENTQIVAGKITLPFGYLNQNQFYPFQRISITAPIFQQSILGLPIADIGAGVTQYVPLGSARLGVDVYAVNGYGPIAGSSDSFRNGALPGALVVSNNLRSSDANNRTAFGGRLTLAPQGNPENQIGVSYYGGQWDPAGNHFFQMANAHLNMNAAGFHVLTEYLFLDTKGDQGFVNNVGDVDWRTNGYFVKTSYQDYLVMGKPLIPWLRYESYTTRGLHNGTGREKLRSPSGGLALRTTPNLILKIEFGRLDYALPFTALGQLKLRANYCMLGATFTF